jgi:hypothetical protein
MASFSTFADPLTASTQNATLWGGNFGTLSWSGGGFLITNPINYTGYGGQDTSASYSLAGAACYCQMSAIGSQSLASCETVPLKLVDSGGTNAVFWYINSGTIGAYKLVAGVQALVSSATYTTIGSPLWFSIAEGTGRKGGTGVSGTTYWEYSTNGTSWTLFTSLADPITETALFLEPSLGTYSNEASSTTAKWTSFNTPPASGVNKGAAFLTMMGA